jgi:hypothetical protein
MTDGINELIELVPILRNARTELKLVNYHEHIIGAREQGATYRKIAKTLKENGITVSTATLRRYILRNQEEDVRRKHAEIDNAHP